MFGLTLGLFHNLMLFCCILCKNGDQIFRYGRMKLEIRRELLQIVQFDSFVMTHAFAAVICESILFEHGEISK